MFGNTGAGKSTIGNLILQKVSFFKTGNSSASCTKQVQKGETPFYMVIDSVGMNDSSLSNDQVKDINRKIAIELVSGFNIALFAFTSRLTDEQYKCFRYFLDEFGKEAISHIMIVKTQYSDFQDESSVENEKKVIVGLFKDNSIDISSENVILLDIPESKDFSKAHLRDECRRILMKKIGENQFQQKFIPSFWKKIQIETDAKKDTLKKEIKSISSNSALSEKEKRMEVEMIERKFKEMFEKQMNNVVTSLTNQFQNQFQKVVEESVRTKMDLSSMEKKMKEQENTINQLNNRKCSIM